MNDNNRVAVSPLRPLNCWLCLDSAHNLKNEILRALATDVDFALAMNKFLFGQLTTKLSGVSLDEKVVCFDEFDREQSIKICVSLQRSNGSLVPPLALIELSAAELKAFSFPLSFQIVLEQNGELITYGSS